NHRLQLVRHPPSIGVAALLLAAAPVLVAGRDQMGGSEQGLVSAAAEQVAADPQRAQRIAMIALQPSDEAMPLLLANLQVILPCELERRLAGFRAATCEENLGQP